MSTSQNSRFISRSTVREITILVVGILIAFSLDAWWDRVSAHASLKDQTVRVLDELRATQQQLEHAIETHQSFANRANSLAKQLSAASPGSFVEVPDTSIATLLPQFTADIGASSVISFLESGGANLIRDPGDRTLIRSWPTVIEDTIDDQVFLRETYTVPLANYLRSNYDLGRSEYADLMYRGSIFFSRPELVSGIEFDSVTLRSETNLINLLNARFSVETLMTLSVNTVLETNKELIKIIEKI